VNAGWEPLRVLTPRAILVNVQQPDLVSLLTEEPQSGERLARRLGVSRVAVFKRARRMREAGYPLRSSRRGYYWPSGTPAPSPLRQRYSGGLLTQAVYLAEASSTQDELLSLAEAGAPQGSVVVAEAQRAGRGRRGRSWLSPVGGLYFSLLLRPNLPLQSLPLLSLAAGAALAAACGFGALKWPNDLLAADGRKLAGVLLEADLRGEEVRHLVLGVGVNFSPPRLAEAAGLSEFTTIGRADVLASFLRNLERLYTSLPNPEKVLAAWRAASATLGRRVRVQTLAGEVAGVAEEVLADGSLTVRTARGKRKKITAGDVELIGGGA